MIGVGPCERQPILLRSSCQQGHIFDVSYLSSRNIKTTITFYTSPMPARCIKLCLIRTLPEKSDTAVHHSHHHTRIVSSRQLSRRTNLSDLSSLCHVDLRCIRPHPLDHRVKYKFTDDGGLQSCVAKYCSNDQTAIDQFDTSSATTFSYALRLSQLQCFAE